MDIKQLWKFFLHAGVGREEYNRLLSRIREENRTLLKVFSQLAGVKLFLLYIESMLSRGFATANSTTCFLSGVVMLVILVCVQICRQAGILPTAGAQPQKQIKKQKAG